jgi:hypothetical protein
MRKVAMAFCSATVLLLAIPTVLAQNPANEHNCPAQTNTGAAALEAEPPYVGSGNDGFSRNQSLCLPQLAPVGTSAGSLAFIVKGVEPGIRVDAQGTVYIDSIRGVPGGGDLWRWYQPIDGPMNTSANNNGTLPFKYEGQPDACGIFANGCTNNTAGVAPGGGDDDIAVNGGSTPNLAFVSLYLANVTGTHSATRGDSFFPNPPNVAVALVPADDRMWIDAFDDTSTVVMNYHDVVSGLIHVQLSKDGGATYLAGGGEAITDPNVIAAANGAGSGNVAGQIRLDKNTNGCSSRGNRYQIFSAPDSGTDSTGPLRTVYVGVSKPSDDVVVGPITNFTFKDHTIYNSQTGSPGAINGTGQVFPALATDNNGWVYAVWSDNTNIYFSSSVDQGTNWGVTPVRVNQGATVGGKSNVFPWVAADANGHVVVVWLGETNIGTPAAPANSNNRTSTGTSSAPMSPMEPPCSGGTNSCWAQWKVYVAETVNGNDAVPMFTQHIASDHIIHSGTVSTGGLGGGANRNLADFFQVALDPNHRANITFADDHVHSPQCTGQSPGHCGDNDAASFRTGVPYFTRQRRANPNIALPGGSGTCFKTVSQVCSGGGGGDDAEGDGDEQGSDGHRGQFTFKTKDKCHPDGEMDFEESDTGEHMKGTRMDSVSVSGNQAIISGAGTLADGTLVNYTAVVLGNAPVTAANNFAISWVTATGSVFQTSGPLTGGYILVHTL